MQVRVHFVAGLVKVLQRRTRKLELSTRLQRNVGAIFGQCDEIVAFVQARPTVVVGQRIQKVRNPALIITFFMESDGAVILEREAEFLVFRPDTPGIFGLIALLQCVNEIVPRFDRGRLSRGWG